MTHGSLQKRLFSLPIQNPLSSAQKLWTGIPQRMQRCTPGPSRARLPCLHPAIAHLPLPSVPGVGQFLCPLSLFPKLSISHWICLDGVCTSLLTASTASGGARKPASLSYASSCLFICWYKVNPSAMVRPTALALRCCFLARYGYNGAVFG